MSRAAREGWRSRAVFKLEQIDTRERLFGMGMSCVDLGACPGSWSQYAVGKVGSTGRVLAVDLQPMDPIRGVFFLQGDFTEAATREQIVAALDGSRADLVMSDMAPNITGYREVDQPRAMHLAEEALEFTTDVLERRGSFLVKLFQGEGFDELVNRARRRFGRVRTIKPKASRPESREMYLLARNHGM
ncbi:MAG: RlmE family RNA methyltransferase [Rhodospirillaceae bacterium]|nr:RlmE family RNA methyltransferase [Rhodospirillaceae bacterium]MDE0360424.1 RlmE family RNA methyltransferase [Rhodospirillaceae bacterium]